MGTNVWKTQSYYLIREWSCQLNVCVLHTAFRQEILKAGQLWCPGNINRNEQHLAHKRTQQRVNNLLPFLGMGGAMLSLCQWHSKVGQVFLPTGTRWWNNQIEAVNCGLSRTFTLPLPLSPHLSPPVHPASLYLLPRVPGVGELCGDTLQLLLWLLNYERGLEATALMKHAARSHISRWRGETCCCGVNYSVPKYHRSHHAKTGDKKPPATSGLPLFPCRLLDTTRPHWHWQLNAAKTTPAAQRIKTPTGHQLLHFQK